MARRLSLALVFAASACATLPELGGGGDNLPNAGAGPFRELVAAELGNLRSPPNAVDDTDTFTRDPSVIDADGDPKTLEVIGFFGAAKKGAAPGDPTRTILRLGALDGRSFDRADEVVLAPQETWEGGVIGQPSALRIAGEIFLYYAAAGGIGLAKSSDGHAFTRVAGPVLGPVMGGWEQGAVPSSPGVVQLASGSFRMFYEIAAADGSTSIGEASSPDGVAWTRLGVAPALAPSAPITGQDEPWDDAAVGSPFPMTAISADGRPILRLYHGARDRQGHAVIGLAARSGDDGPLERSTAPVFGSGKTLGPREPCLVAYSGFTLLFATQKAKTTMDHPAVAAGLAPATASLPAPDPP